MAVTDTDEADIIRLLGEDVLATRGGRFADDIRAHAARIREFHDDRALYFDMVVQDVQQDFHDLFIDTTWPTCPFHRRHPLWYHDGFWVCEQSGTRVAPLGGLAQVPKSGPLPPPANDR